MSITLRPARLLVGAVAVLGLLAAGCGDDDDVSSGDATGVITVTEAWSRQPAEGQTATAVYGIVSNPTDTDVTIVAASSPVSAQVELHETLVDDEGVMQMVEREDGFVVPAGGDFVFEPGGPHVMMLGIDSSTYPDEVEVTLEFDSAEPLTFTAEVREIAGENDMSDMGDMEHDDADGDMSDMEHDDADGDMGDMEQDDADGATGDMEHDDADGETVMTDSGDEHDHGDAAEEAEHDHAEDALDVSALHEVDEQLAAGGLDVEAQRMVVADYIAAVEAMEPADGSAEAELLAALQDLDSALEAENIVLAAELAATAHDLAHDLGHDHG